MSQEVEASPHGSDPVAISLALGGASRATADHFLELQMEEMRAEEPYKLSHYRLRRFGDWAKAAFEFSLGLLALALVGGLSLMLWNAAHDDGLVIEAFAVPPDLAERGFTGQVVAARMLDNLSALQAQNNSSRAPSSFANNWGNDLKVEIPETGVSIGELNRYLHQMLGHQTHITGEVVHEGTGLTVTARAGADTAKPVSGSEADFNALLQEASEAVYARTQPYRYGVQLLSAGRNAEAMTVLEESTRVGSQIDRAWAHAGLFNVLASRGLIHEALESAQASVALKPDFAWGWFKVSAGHSALGHAEATLEATRKSLQLLEAGGQTDLRPDAVTRLKRSGTGDLDDDLGDYADEIRQELAMFPSLASSAGADGKIRAMLLSPGNNLGTAVGNTVTFASNLIRLHDLAGARHVLVGGPAFIAATRTIAESRGDAHAQSRAGLAAFAFQAAELLFAQENEDWTRAVQIASSLDAGFAPLAAADNAPQGTPSAISWPIGAYTQARAGDFAAAHAKIDKTPRDCDLCLRTRGRIDAVQKNWDGATFWFAEAVRQAPSIPFAYADWGRMLLDKGDLDGAIEKFAIANQKGPHFADAIEMWGEALLLQKHPDLAAAKFAEAEKYAPNWGRLHLKWGEALAYVGKKDEAAKQLSRAAQLDLTPPEKSELARVRQS
jgi:tetratricopeptide (TPR) repeat protein